MTQRTITTWFTEKLLLMGLVFLSHHSYFFQSVNGAGYIIGSRPYARSLQGMYYFCLDIVLLCQEVIISLIDMYLVNFIIIS